jgi:predicted lipoprotein with Yx(FWY)xxD motif
VSSPPSSEAPESPPPASSAAPSAGPLEIKAKETRFGRILVDGRGMTIYVAGKDNADFESTCTGACLREWPPLFTNGQVNAGPGVNSAWLGTIGRSDGPTQVEYNGWPLYYYARDGEPGDMKGRGVVSDGTTWYVIDADRGQKVK